MNPSPFGKPLEDENKQQAFTQYEEKHWPTCGGCKRAFFNACPIYEQPPEGVSHKPENPKNYIVLPQFGFRKEKRELGTDIERQGFEIAKRLFKDSKWQKFWHHAYWRANEDVNEIAE